MKITIELDGFSLSVLAAFLVPSLMGFWGALGVGF
jgi:hypothetical protein